MCFVHNMSAISWQYWGWCHSNIVTVSECPLASYKKYNDEFRCEVENHAVFYGARLTAKKYGVSQPTVRGFVKLLKRQPVHNPDVDFIALPQKKRGQSKLLPEESDQKVVNMIKSMWE